MATLLRRALTRPLIHVHKSLYFQSFLATKSNLQHQRHFVDDPKDATTTTVIEIEKEDTKALEPVEQFELPPMRPTYQTKTPMELIAEVPIIEVDAQFVKCDGMWFESDMSPRRKDVVRHPMEGHPMQWITLNTRKPFTPQTCKYCGLRFVMQKPADYVDPWLEYESNQSNKANESNN
eukprot:UN13658